jgi:peptide/nickel transport system substrate-binding protein
MNRIAVIINIVLLLISCRSDSDTKSLNLFRYNCENDITSLDPAFASNQDNIWAVSQLFNGLLQLDSNLRPIPSIAKSWEIDKEGKIYTFHLRKNVYFHPSSCFSEGIGRKVIADDFVYSFARIMDSKTASPGAWIFNDKVGENPFIALDDSTFQIKLKQAFAPFTGILTMPYCMVVPHEAISLFGKDFSSHPVGTGPFQFKRWEEDVSLLLTKNNDFFEKDQIRGNVDAVNISFVHNRQMALLLFLEGKLEMYNGLSGAVKDYLLTHDGKLQSNLKDDVNLEITPFLNTEYLAIFSDAKSAAYPYNNSDFRKSVSLAIDRRKMLKYLRNNIGHSADGGFIPLGLPGHIERSEVFNISKAKEHLGLSGYLNNPVPIDLYTTKDYADLCIYVQKQLAEINIDCRLQVIPASHLKEQKRQGKLNFFRASWIMDYPDAENYLSCFYTSSFAPGGPNYTHFSNATFDDMYEKALVEANDSVRYSMYREMDKLIMEDSPIVVLYYDESIRLTRKHVTGLTNNALNVPVIKHVHLMN